MDVIYTDFSKDFDRVNHDFLLYNKLSSYNIHSDILSLLRILLVGNIDELLLTDCSSWNAVPSGVPQGSILGPTLFTLFVNDIPQYLDNKCLLFVDDLKVYGKLGCPADATSLQEDLNRIMTWSEIIS